MPRVTVLMAVKNGAAYLSEAIDSVIQQTFRDFEFLVIDDGSEDGSAEIVNSYKDPRIRLLRNERNMGLSAALNKGLECAEGEFIARMDADDLSTPRRLARQVAFLDEHPEIGLVGGVCEEIDTSGRLCGARTVPASDLEIRWGGLLACPLLHPTVVMRRAVLVAHGLSYDESFIAAQDYDLWTRMLRVTRAANLHEPLLQYRLGHGITKMSRQIQLEEHDLIALRTIKEHLPDLAITRDEVSQLRALLVGGEDRPPPIGRRALLLRKYLDMFTAFVNAHVGAPGLSALRRAEGLRVARHMRAASLPIRAPDLVLRLIRMDPGLLFHAAHRWLRQISVGRHPNARGVSSRFGRGGEIESSSTVREHLKGPR